MARVSKTSPFRPREQPETRSNTEGEKKDEEEDNDDDDEEEEESSSSSSLEKNTEDKKQEKAMGKRSMQDKVGKRKTTVNEMISGPERANRFVTKRGRGKPMAYTVRLWSEHNPWVDVPVSSNDELKNADPKPKSTQDKKQGKRPMQARNGNQKATLAEGSVTKTGRGKSTAYTKRSPRKRVGGRVYSKFEPKSGDPKLKEADEDFQGSETDSEEVCNRIQIERHNADDDTDNDGPGAGTHGNLTSLGMEIVGK